MTHSGRLYIPPQAISNPGQPRPLILFLHGGGEAGNDNLLQINSNIDNLLSAAKLRGAFLYAPQSPGPWSSSFITDNVVTMLDRALAEQNVDSNRVYITGLSNGGGGTWNMLSRYPERFAAALPIAAVPPAADFNPAHLLTEPVLAFHARNDITVAVSATRNVISSVLATDGESLPSYPPSNGNADFFISNPNLDIQLPVRNSLGHSRGLLLSPLAGSPLDLMYYEFTMGGHGIWSTVYSQPSVYEWMFAHGAPIPEPSTSLLAAVGMLLCTSARSRS